MATKMKTQLGMNITVEGEEGQSWTMRPSSRRRRDMTEPRLEVLATRAHR